MTEAPDVLILRRGVHGIPVDEYAAALRDRLPDRRVAVAATPAEERRLIANAPVVTGVTIDRELLEHADALGLFCAGSAGIGHLPMEAFAARDVAVTNASGVHGPNIAEHVLGAILTFTRGFLTAQERKRRREWRHFQARELKGSTVTVVGLGAIGQAVVDRLEPFEVTTLGVRYTPSKGGPTDEVFGMDEEDLHAALARTEYLVVACPLTETTEGLIGTAEFATLPPESVLINVARGAVVETDALVAALQGERIAGAALDVTDPEPLPEEHPLWGLGNVLLTPHMAGHTPAYPDRLADIVAENAERFLGTDTADELRNRVG